MTEVDLIRVQRRPRLSLGSIAEHDDVEEAEVEEITDDDAKDE